MDRNSQPNTEQSFLTATSVETAMSDTHPLPLYYPSASDGHNREWNKSLVLYSTAQTLLKH